MSKIKQSATELIGNTPLLQLNNYANDTKATILAKLEYLNPAGSIKDRVAFHMIEAAVESGKLKKGATIIEPTSGNTGIGLALVAAALGYKCILTLPDTMSVERRNLLKAYGAKIVLTPGDKGMQGAIDKANELNKEVEGSIILGQFDNDTNPETHILTTGPEIWDQTDGKVDILVATVGTGGTITGIGKYLKKQNPNIKVVAVEPSTSAVLSGKEAGPHKIQGIGAGFKPSILNLDYVDEVMTITDEEAYQMTRDLAQVEGLFVGISSGCNVAAAIKVAKSNPGKVIVTVLPDNGERYLSVEGLFE
jgi:cysteine synthase A